MTETKTCTRCKQDKQLNNYDLFKNGNYKKTCNDCLESIKKSKWFRLDESEETFNQLKQDFEKFNYTFILYNHNTFDINFRVKVIEKLLLETKIIYIDKLEWGTPGEICLFYKRLGFSVYLPPRRNCVILIMSFDGKNLIAYWIPEPNIVRQFMLEKNNTETHECGICLNNVTNYYSCYQCDKAQCHGCFKSQANNNKIIHSCPYCRYTLKEHLNKNAVRVYEYHLSKVTIFLDENKYPSYEEVIKIIGNDKMMKAEYDEENHKLMKSIWDNITDINNIKKIGYLLHKKGKFRAMVNNHWAFMYVVRYFIEKNKILDFKIKDSIYKIINDAWRDIDDWRTTLFNR